MCVLADQGYFNISDELALTAHLLPAESATDLVFPLGLRTSGEGSFQGITQRLGCVVSPLALLLECSGQDKWCYWTMLCSPLSPAPWVMVWAIARVLVTDPSWQGSTFRACCGERQWDQMPLLYPWVWKLCGFPCRLRWAWRGVFRASRALLPGCLLAPQIAPGSCLWLLSKLGTRQAWADSATGNNQGIPSLRLS